MTRLSKTFIALAGAGLLSVAAVQAQPQTPGPRAAGPRVPSLTDTQRDEIRKIRDEMRTTMREHNDKLRQLRRQYHEQLFAEKPDQAKLSELRTQMLGLDQKIAALRLEQHERIVQLLTPEQRQAMRDRGWRAFGGPRGRGMRGPGRHHHWRW